MKTLPVVVLIAMLCLAGCNKSGSPAPANTASASPASPDPVQEKLQEYAGSGATDCGRLDVHAADSQLKGASDCSMQANQSKHAFYVAYDMPGMSVGIAGDANGKLLSVQSQGNGASAALTTGACPAALRVASSGRLTCFAPGDMTSMSGSHAGAPVGPGTPNPHTGGTANPHATRAAKPPSNQP
jgi:hypothetical protein